MVEIVWLTEALNSFFEGYPNIPDEVKETVCNQLDSRLRRTHQHNAVHAQTACCTDTEQWLGNLSVYFTDSGSERFAYRITGMLASYPLPSGFPEIDLES